MTATAPTSGTPASDVTLGTLQRFAAAMAHEINNPLGALVLNAEVATMLIDRGRADELPAVLRQIQTDARRCAAKVRNMADVAAPASAARAGFALAETLSAVRQRMCRRLNRLLNTIALDVPPKLAPVHGNRDAIEYALYQLARQVYASGVDHPRVAVASHGERTCVSIGTNEPAGLAFPEDGVLAAPPRFAHDEAALDVTRCLLTGSRAELFVTSHGGRLAYHVLFERARE